MGNKIAAASLITAAILYTLVVSFIILSTIGFSGLDWISRRLVTFLMYLLIAASPILVWRYCLKRVRAWGKGEPPHF